MNKSAVEAAASNQKALYWVAGVAALVALAANVLDILLGFGEMEIVVNGTKPASEWFALFQANWFKGIYVLGILNIVYMMAMIPVYFALVLAHGRMHRVFAALAMVVAFMGMAIYIANNAAIPMFVLASRYAAAGTDAQRVIFAAAGEAVLVRGEDFTPGSFLGLFFTGIAGIAISAVMLRGEVFGRATAWVGIVGFTFLSIFTVWATFIPVLYEVAFYGFGMIGGLLALIWFFLVALRCFKFARSMDAAANEDNGELIAGHVPT
jgi:hypothetical protein